MSDHHLDNSGHANRALFYIVGRGNMFSDSRECESESRPWESGRPNFEKEFCKMFSGQIFWSYNAIICEREFSRGRMQLV